MVQARSRVEIWTNRVLLALFLACLVLSYRLARPFLSPLVLAAFLVAVLNRPYAWLERKMGRHKRLAAGLATLVVSLVLVLPTAIFVSVLVNQLLTGISRLRGWLGPGGFLNVLQGRLPERLQQILEPIQRALPVTGEDLRRHVAELAAYLSSIAPSVVASSLEYLIQAFVLALSLYYFFADGEELVSWLIRISPLQSRYTRELVTEFYQVAFAMLVGTAAIAVAQGVSSWLIFWLLGISTPVVWAMAVAFASFVPAVGTGLVWVPMAVILFVLGHVAKAIVLLVYCLAVIVIFVDHLLRPLVVKEKMTLHPLVIFVSIFGGVYLFGLVGLLLGPLIAAVLITVMRIYARDLSPRQPGPRAPAG